MSAHSRRPCLGIYGHHTEVAVFVLIMQVYTYGARAYAAAIQDTHLRLRTVRVRKEKAVLTQ